MSNQYDYVSIKKKANIMYGGICVSHTFYLRDGKEKIIGVILPSCEKLSFKLNKNLNIEIIEGSGEIKLDRSSKIINYKEGDFIKINKNFKFHIKVNNITDYIIHFE